MVTKFQASNSYDVETELRRHLRENFVRTMSQKRFDYELDRFGTSDMISKKHDGLRQVMDEIENQGRYKGPLYVQGRTGPYLNARVDVELRDGMYHGKLYHGKG